MSHVLSNGRRYDEYYAPFPPDSFAPRPGDRRLNVAIIGAGVAGLTAAIGLLQCGHDVELYERSEFAMEIGAAIQAAPNAARILSYFEFDFARAMPVAAKEFTLFNGRTLDVLKCTQWPDMEARYAAPFYTFHRVDLHQELMRLATEPRPNTAATAKIHLLSQVATIDVAGKIVLMTGKELKKDLVVVADGIRTRFISDIVGINVPVRAKATGTAVYRFLVPTSELLEDPQTKPMFERGNDPVNIALLKDARLVWYPCRGGKLQNFGFFHLDPAEGVDDEVFNIPATQDEFMASCRELHPDLRAVCAKAHDLKLWRLCERENPIHKLTKGKVVAVGDAAHPMLPHQGQGGGMAIEDGAALGVLFSHFGPDDIVEDRLALFERLRLKRVSAMQIFSSVGQDEAAQIVDRAQPYVDGKVPESQDEFHDWNYTPNVLRDAKEMLDKWKTERKNGGCLVQEKAVLKE